MIPLIENVENFVVHYLNENMNANYIYHNLSHTQRVVEKTKELIVAAKIEGELAENLELAAWFHDLGYSVSTDGHEEKSVRIASEFLKQNDISDDRITAISDLIIATKMDVVPETEGQKILKDADCSHVGSKSFSDLSELLRKEWELTLDKKVSESAWLKENISFLTEHHRFYSAAASKEWGKQKGKNLSQLLKAQKKLKQDSVKLKQRKDELSFKKNKVELPERGIETMFRVALRNHITLSDIADTKANILLSVNAIIVSLAMANLLPKLDNPSNGYLIAPTVVFVCFTVATIVLSVMATRPNVTEGKFSKEDVANKKVNLLFFGNFHQMKLNDFEWAMGEMMQDREYLYNSLTKDLYFLGLVLNRKYKLLRVTYTVFMIGILVSVVAFAVAFRMQAIS